MFQYNNFLNYPYNLNNVKINGFKLKVKMSHTSNQYYTVLHSARKMEKIVHLKKSVLQFFEMYGAALDPFEKTFQKMLDFSL